MNLAKLLPHCGNNGSGESSLISGLRVTLDRHRKQTSRSCSSVMSGNDHSKLREAPQRQLSCGRLLTAASHQNRFISHALDSFQTAACCSELAPVLLRTLNLASHYQCIMAVCFFCCFFLQGYLILACGGPVSSPVSAN